MQNPESYNKNNTYPTKSAQYFLEKYGKMCKWRRGAAIIDIGSGDGFITSNVLEEYICEDVGKILGVDINEDMVNFANKHYATEKIQFSTLDIAGPVPDELKRSFQHAVSFLCLHWVSDQRKAIQNIYDILADDGNCLMTLVQNSNFYEMFKVLALSEKWRHLAGKPALELVEDLVSKYHDSKTPEKDLRNVLEETGFKDIIVDSKVVPHLYDDIESMKDFMMTLNPLKLPRDLLEEFGVDVIQTMSDLHLMEAVEKGSGIIVNATHMIACASK